MSDSTAIFIKILLEIIKEQESVIGPLAWIEAGKVAGLQIIDLQKNEIAISGNDPKNVVNSLVERYERLFGRASREVCRDAVASIIADLAPSDIPSSLVA